MDRSGAVKLLNSVDLANLAQDSHVSVYHPAVFSSMLIVM